MKTERKLLLSFFLTAGLFSFAGLLAAFIRVGGDITNSPGAALWIYLVVLFLSILVLVSGWKRS